MINILMTLEASFPISRPIDDELISKIAQGDTEALHILYDSAKASIYGFVLSITKNTHDAADVLQETFLSVYEKAHTYEPKNKPMAWILVIAKNHALSKLRSRNKIHLMDDENAEIGISFSKIDNAEQRMVLETAFKILKDEEREILMLHAVSGLKHREIAKVLDLSINTVLSKYNRSIKKMQAELLKGEGTL